ncbi:uncharacterized protein LOC117178097 [Belonocnema kinseyi]|uniref:uncharacterized protein LOC117178097 n=1 Tax=Belonocnema kinseyi TaxID=2817044 RepID=UPI00143DCB7C|nr:uncharacterized protein LOC117178097 [Belonocnema kinseyi]
MVNLVDFLEYDIHDVLQNSENDDSVILHKLSLACSEFRSSISVAINNFFTREKEFVEKSKSNSETISQINNQIKNTEKELDAVLLNQKVTDREISHIIKQQENHQESVKHIREQRETISLEIVDLEHELEKRKKEKKLDWDAIKRACFIYKDKLDIRIKVDTVNDVEKVTVTFFVKEYHDQFYVVLAREANSWKVEKIEPDLKAKHRNDLNTVIEFSNDFRVKNITSFLCRVRHIYLKHYCGK